MRGTREASELEEWQEPLGPADHAGFAYLGLDRVFGAHASREQLLGCAHAALERAAFYRAQWVANRAFEDLRPNPAQARRLRAMVAGGHGALVCTFQIGPFLQLPFTLSALGLPLMLLMDPDNYRCGVEVCAYTGMTPGAVPLGHWPRQETVGAEPKGEPVRFVTSSDPSVAWKMTRWLRGGNVVFAYLDGNRGLDQGQRERTCEVVRFFGIDIWVRKGLAYLAGSAGVPLVFLVARKREDTHVLHLSPPLRRRTGEPLPRFCRRALQSGFRLLEAHIRQDPACWSEWGQIHHWAVRPPQPVAAEPTDGPSAEEALRRRLRVEPQTVQLRLGTQDVLVNHASGAAVVFTPLVRDVLRLAGEGRTVEEVVSRLNGDYEEETLLEAIQALAKDAFLQAGGA